MVRDSRWLLSSGFIIAGLIGSAVPGAEQPDPGQALMPVDLWVDTLRIGANGTEVVASDEARVLPGRGALLEREVKISGKGLDGKESSEWLRFRAEIQVREPRSLDEPRFTLDLRSRVEVLAASGGHPLPGGAVDRHGEVVLREGSSQIFEIYDSSPLGSKVALHVRWSSPDADASEDEGRPVPLVIQLFEGEGQTTRLLTENRLRARIRGGAGATFHRNYPLEPAEDGSKRVREERVEVSVRPEFRIGEELGVLLEVTGQISTLTTERTFIHPLSHKQRLLLASGDPAALSLEVTADEPVDEGWKRVRYRLEVRAFF